MKDNWITKSIDQSTVDYNSKFLNINKPISSILYARGYKTPRDIDNFLNPRISSLNSPFQMKGMYEAISRIRKAISDDEKIGIFSDSDIDGLTSLKILHKLFNKLGNHIFIRYLKDYETYGLTKEIIDEFINNGASLIITVDSGTRDVDEIEYGNNNGLDFIVTDHHEQDSKLPDAIVINPKQKDCSYSFRYLAGVGVAFKLSQAILQSYLPSFNRLFLLVYKSQNGEYFISFVKNCIVDRVVELQKDDIDNEIEKIIKDSSEGVSLIICNNEIDNKLKIHENIDIYNILELSGPVLKLNAGNLSIDKIAEYFSFNEKLYERKIDLMNSIFLEIQYLSSPKIIDFINSSLEFVALGSIADVVPLIDENRVLVTHGIKSINRTEHGGLNLIKNSEIINSKKIGWSIAPLLNSPGRFGETHLTAGFFLEEDIEKLKVIISRIKELNEYRKQLVQKIFTEIMEKINKKKIDSSGNLIFIKSEEIPEGLAGLIANKITDSLNKPVIIAASPGANGLIKGSGRSKGEFNFFNFVEPNSHMFEKIGGHAQAFGFTVKIDKIDEIISVVRDSIGDDFIPGEKYEIDYEIKLDIIDSNFINRLSSFEPFGKDNEEILFLSKNVKIKGFKAFGSGNKHGRYVFNDNRSLKSIGWNKAEEMELIKSKNEFVDIIFTLENNNYMNNVYPQLILVDIDYEV